MKLLNLNLVKYQKMLNQKSISLITMMDLLVMVWIFVLEHQFECYMDHYNH
jgi:hypothetical protein